MKPLTHLEQDSLAKEVFGPDFHATFIEYKREEWNVYNTIVTEWEQDRYLRLWCRGCPRRCRGPCGLVCRRSTRLTPGGRSFWAIRVDGMLKPYVVP